MNDLNIVVSNFTVSGFEISILRKMSRFLLQRAEHEETINEFRLSKSSVCWSSVFIFPLPLVTIGENFFSAACFLLLAAYTDVNFKRKIVTSVDDRTVVFSDGRKYTRCHGVDLGDRLILTALHCADALPDDAHVIVRGIISRSHQTGLFDYIIVRIENWRLTSPLDCNQADNTTHLYLQGRPVRVIARSSGFIVLDALTKKGMSGTPVFAEDNTLVSIVIAMDNNNRTIAFAPGIVCTVVMLARNRIER